MLFCWVEASDSSGAVGKPLRFFFHVTVHTLRQSEKSVSEVLATETTARNSIRNLQSLAMHKHLQSSKPRPTAVQSERRQCFNMIFHA